jgi:hypothetical protein
MSTTSFCPCDSCSFPEVISNVPGLPAIEYRIGDFTAFRNAMLQSLPGEVELANWKPTSTSDLALQMIEWWAYLADILTFYNQRIANQDYLGTADLDVSVRNLVSLLGYRPTPGVGATATLAALVSGGQSIVLPQGMAVQSKPGPGSAPQIFELLQKTTAQPGGSISADPDNSQAEIGQDGSILLEGTISSIKTGDLLLLVRDGWDGSDLDYLLGNVLSIQPRLSPRGTKYTQVFLSNSALPMPSGSIAPIAANYRLMRSTQTARLFQYGVNIDLSLVYNAGTSGQADLDSVTRLIQPGDMVLFDSLNGQTGGAFQGAAAPAPSVPPPAPPPARPGPPKWTLGGLEVEDFGAIDFTSFAEKEQIVLNTATAAAQSLSAPHALESQMKIQQGGFDGSEIPSVSEESAIAAELLGDASGSSAPATQPVPSSMYLTSVNTYTELIWYADHPSSPTTASAPGAGIPVLHSEITFTPGVSAPNSNTLVVRYGWQNAGVVIAPFATAFDGFDGAENLIPVTPPSFPSEQLTALLQDTNGAGALVNGTVVASKTGLNAPGELQLTDTLLGTADLPLNPALTPPINVLTNLLPFTRGKTVVSEVLGSGDATQMGQVFKLAKSPLTYLLSAQSTSGNNYTSTLKVWVNGVQWQEQPSFYGQPPNATIFVTREDNNAVTYVQFGDGVYGARLPSGANNVTASYRYGSGSQAPAAGALTVINTPQPGLASIQNPVAAGGGADPEPSSQMRKYAPLSVLTLGRAISGEDYEAIAISTPSVARASAIWNFDPVQQRTAVTVYVGDDQAAQSAAQLALSGDADPNRPVTVLLATPIPLTVTLNLVVNPNYDPNTTAALAVTALTDPDVGLFGASLGIGQAVYRSQIYAACLSVPGALSVNGLSVKTNSEPGGNSYIYDPGPGNYFTLSPVYGGAPLRGLQITPEGPNG